MLRKSSIAHIGHVFLYIEKIFMQPFGIRLGSFSPKEKYVLMDGVPSPLDTFDRKPLLNKLAGQPLPDTFVEPITAMGEKGSPVLEAPRTWKQYGESGLWCSDWVPHTAECIDDIAVLNSCWGTGINHSGGTSLMMTCDTRAGRPALGAWTTYGLGTENADLPAYVVLTDKATLPVNGQRMWGSAFMPALYQGTHFTGGIDEPIANLKTPKSISEARQQDKLKLLYEFNREHASTREQQSELEARIKSYELAYRMQSSAPEAVDLSKETEATKEMYGLNDEVTSVYGRNCLLARRMVERGVRFIQLYNGAGSKWDSHSNIEAAHPKLCQSMDKPIAGLLKDLKQRGLLDETLVVWGGEFGRTPMSEKGNGRDHNPSGFTMWMAGGGVKGGQTIGATDEVGLHAVENRLNVSDIHASILHLMGLDNRKLSYSYKGRMETPTINQGKFCKQLI